MLLVAQCALRDCYRYSLLYSFNLVAKLMIQTMWTILTIIAGISILFYWRGGRNAVWGGITFGLIVGLIVAIVYAILGNGFHWSIIGKGIVVCVLLGVGADWLGKLSDYLKKKSNRS